MNLKPEEFLGVTIGVRVEPDGLFTSLVGEQEGGQYATPELALAAARTLILVVTANEEERQ